MVVYIAGKMNGLSDLGKAKFAAAAERLRGMGYVVLNPAELPDHMPLDRYMPICLAMVQASDAVYSLDNWRSSAGALLEVQFARYQGKEIIHEPERLMVAPEPVEKLRRGLPAIGERRQNNG